MGRTNTKYKKDLKEQIYSRLEKMLKDGEGFDKREAAKNDLCKEMIFSYGTFHDYYKRCKVFADYINTNHPECTTIKSARKHVNEWLQFRVDMVDEKGNHLSSWTIHKDAKALGKLYGISADSSNYFKPPKRERKNIKRSRVDAVRDKHFSITNNDEFIKFCKGVGARRTALGKLKGEDLWSREEMLQEIKTAQNNATYKVDSKDKNALNSIIDALRTFPDQDYFVHFIKDKGGRSRFAPIIGDNKQQIIDRMKATRPGKKVWEHIPTNADIHSYRGDYATAIYKIYAKEVKDISYKETVMVNGKAKKRLYACRKDEAGKKLDRLAMLKCSKALGHNRESVVADHYLRGL